MTPAFPTTTQAYPATAASSAVRRRANTAIARQTSATFNSHQSGPSAACAHDMTRGEPIA